MIVKLTGVVSEVEEHAVVIERGGLSHEILVPRYALGELAAYRGREVTLHTLEFYEGNAGGGHLIPRIIGFLHKEDKAFFRLFIHVKGIGPRKALKALAEPVTRIAEWIRGADYKSLSSLPGLGRKAAEMMVTELKGKIDLFAGEPAVVATQWSEPQRDAIEVLVAWGDSRNDAERWLERSAQLHPDLSSPQEWVRACYRIKTGAEG